MTTERKTTVPIRRALIPKPLMDALMSMSEMDRWSYLYGELLALEAKVKELEKLLDYYAQKEDE